MKLDGVEVNIRTYNLDDPSVPRTKLEEYGEQEEEITKDENLFFSSGKTKKCFIQSDEGKHFSIEFDIDGLTSYSARVLIDGQLVKRRAMNGQPTKPGRIRKRYTDFKPCEGKKMYFRFEKNSTTDDQTLAIKDAHLISSLGKIEIQLRKTIYTPSRMRRSSCYSYNRNVFDEKTKKGLIDHALGGTIRPSEDTMSMGYQHGALSAPINFIFAYRSKKWLQAEDFIEYVADESATPPNGLNDPIETAIRASYPNIPVEEIKIKVENFKNSLQRNNQAAENNVISLDEEDDSIEVLVPPHGPGVTAEQVEVEQEPLRNATRTNNVEVAAEQTTIDLTDE